MHQLVQFGLGNVHCYGSSGATENELIHLLLSNMRVIRAPTWALFSHITYSEISLRYRKRSRLWSNLTFRPEPMSNISFKLSCILSIDFLSVRKLKGCFSPLSIIDGLKPMRSKPSAKFILLLLHLLQAFLLSIS